MPRIVSGIAVLALVAGLFATPAPRPAAACVPGWVSLGLSLQEIIDNSEFVVSGSPYNIKTIAGPQYTYAEASFAVRRYFKGDGPDVIHVRDTLAGTLCGFLSNLQNPDAEFLVFLWRRDDHLDIINPHRLTGLYADPNTARAFVGQVEALTRPSSLPATGGDPSAPQPEPDFPYFPAATIALLIPALLLGAAALYPRR